MQIDAKNIGAWLGLAAAKRQLNDIGGAYEALRQVLRIEPRHFHALLMTASLLELEGRLKSAASAYGAALANMPPPQFLDAATRQAAEHGRAVHERHTRELNEHIRDQIAGSDRDLSSSERRRIEAFIGTTLRTRPRYQQEPTDYYYPGLPAIEFYDREELPWIEEFEAATPEIQEQLDLLRGYLSDGAADESLYNRLMILWASSGLDGVLDASQRRTIVADAVRAQEPDGGWSLAALAPWQRLDDSVLPDTSDGYATALAVVALDGTRDPAAARAIEAGRAWLITHQDPTTGAVPAQSINRLRDPATEPSKFMTDAATALASLAMSR